MTDGDHPRFPLLLDTDAHDLDDVRAVLAEADAVGDLGTDLAATLARVTSCRPWAPVPTARGSR